MTVLVWTSWPRLAAFDEEWASRSYAYAADHAGLRAVAGLVTALGNGVTIVVLTAAACIACLVARRRMLALWLAVTVAGGALLNTAIKLGLERTRPPTAGALTSAHGFSYPSGHTQAATVTYSAVLLAVGWQLCRPSARGRRASATIVAMLVAGVGASRVLLGAHWPSDVVGGWLLGSTWVAAATLVLSRLQTQPPREAVRTQRPRATSP